jgi:hypothetical protein
MRLQLEDIVELEVSGVNLKPCSRFIRIESPHLTQQLSNFELQSFKHLRSKLKNPNTKINLNIQENNISFFSKSWKIIFKCNEKHEPIQLTFSYLLM